MCDVPRIDVFCSESMECFPGTSSKFFLKLLVTIPVTPIITGTIVHFRFHIRCISIHKRLYFNFLSSSFCTTFCLRVLQHLSIIYYYYYYYGFSHLSYNQRPPSPPRQLGILIPMYSCWMNSDLWWSFRLLWCNLVHVLALWPPTEFFQILRSRRREGNEICTLAEQTSNCQTHTHLVQLTIILPPTHFLKTKEGDFFNH